MIKFNSIDQGKPYLIFKSKYEEAVKLSQKNIDAMSISSFSKSSNEVNSRYVNLKYLDGQEFIFFSNYESIKSQDFKEHTQITALIFWNSINTQIRIKASIKKTSIKFNKNYFSNRSKNKNALAISSDQSRPINSYEDVIKKYNETLKSVDLTKCPSYWGGYSFTPYYFEFWEGHDIRLNKRSVFTLNDKKWNHSFLQP